MNVQTKTRRPTTWTAGLWGGATRRRVAAVTATTMALSVTAVIPAIALPASADRAVMAPAATTTDAVSTQGPWAVQAELYGTGRGWYTLRPRSL
ncbi:hypothetical protein EV643_119116 [Kribbella sp. VKM Ac-2527]|uniref:Uncharacterized protein n=1 Tax=Kribbella caucasensis TaxID=2512215 RepID=A0A4R6K1P7_9ACTN|nr:hypothetical protein [Kribbella sp. VKM Ac-2527]TDO43183.1 hypothetical protein EV643_119116 [Kribbella sp. VKM Ac-2527]